MIAAEIIRQVLDAGGQITADGSDLVLTAPRPLPQELLAQIKAYKAAVLESLAGSDPSPPLSRAAEARRRKVLALARDGTRYAVFVDDPNTDPVIAALATPAGSYEVQIPRDRYDPFGVLAMVRRWEA